MTLCQELFLAGAKPQHTKTLLALCPGHSGLHCASGAELKFLLSGSFRTQNMEKPELTLRFLESSIRILGVKHPGNRVYMPGASNSEPFSAPLAEDVAVAISKGPAVSKGAFFIQLTAVLTESLS